MSSRWWSVFWELFEAKSNVHGTEDAKLYVNVRAFRYLLFRVCLLDSWLSIGAGSGITTYAINAISKWCAANSDGWSASYGT